MHRPSYIPGFQIERWRTFFRECGLKPEIESHYIEYIKPLISRRIPVIFGFRHMSDLMGIEAATLGSMVNATESFYRQFRIPKQSGGKRTIAAPYPSLLHCQRWIVAHVLHAFHISPAAHAFVSKRSIFSNAEQHCGAPFVLKLDFKDFFYSVSQQKVIALFVSLGYTRNVAFYLSSICTLNGSLPQGGSTSPALSNIVCRRFDQRMIGFARRNKLRYSRYADDVTISGDLAYKNVEAVATKIATEEGFAVNAKKSRLLKRGQKIVVTGLDISSGSPRPTRAFRRDLEKEVFYLWRFGVADHMNAEKIYDPVYLLRVKGKLSFWQSIEPENVRLRKSIERFRSATSDYFF